MSTSELIHKYPLRREKILKKTLTWVLFPSIILLVLSLILVGVLGSALGLLPLLLILVLASAAYWYESEYFRKYFYDLTGEGIMTRKGVFSTHEVVVPPHKVQDVYLDQDMFDRAFGLWDLHISSATETSGSEAHIDGLGEESARELREVLLRSFVSEREQATAQVLKHITPSRRGLASIFIGSIMGFVFLFLWLSDIWPLVVLIALGGLAWAYMDFTVLRYELRENGVFVRRGYIMRSENLFLYKNIQDVEESANLWDRVFGIKTLSIKTMTGESAKAAMMPYISAAEAPSLREEIIGLAKQESRKEEKAVKRKAPDTAAFEIAPEEKEKPQIPEQDMPYANRFYRGAAYEVFADFLYTIPFLFLITVVGLFIHPLTLLFVGGIAFLILVLILLKNLPSAFLMTLSYRYKVSSDFILVKTGILNIIKKQINYNKIQDVEKSVSFGQSFAKLATIKLETGSKELVGTGMSGLLVTQNEVVPALGEDDAEKLKSTIIGQMGFSNSTIGQNPLVSRLPLEAVKPLKKTFWWVFYSIVILVAATGAVLASGSNLTIIPTILFLFLASACILKYVYEYYYYKSYFYDVNDDVLVIRKGVFGSRELTIPFEKIQDVFVDRDWLDLLFGLYDVYVSTVSSRSLLNAHIDGVNEKNAEQAALLLLKKIKAA